MALCDLTVDLLLSDISYPGVCRSAEMWIVLAKQNDWGTDVSIIHPLKITVHKIQSCCTSCIIEILHYICLMWMQLHQFCCIARLWGQPTHSLIKLYHRFSYTCLQSSNSFIWFIPVCHMFSKCSLCVCF